MGVKSLKKMKLICMEQKILNLFVHTSILNSALRLNSSKWFGWSWRSRH